MNEDVIIKYFVQNDDIQSGNKHCNYCYKE